MQNQSRSDRGSGVVNVRGFVLGMLGVTLAVTSCSSPSSSTTHTSNTSTTAPAAGGAHAVDWSEASVALDACGLPGVVRLFGGSANFGGTIPAEEPRHPEQSRELSIGHVTFGDVTGDRRDEAFVPVLCTNGGGTADGQTAFAVEVFTVGRGGPGLLGILRPTQPFSPGTPHIPYMDDASIRVRGHRVVNAIELWYDTSDSTCCPSLRVLTTWIYRGGRFDHESSTPPPPR